MISGKELEFFKELEQIRRGDSKTFNNPEYVNVFKGVIDKYSDTAHFVYELLQNADDALATEVEFKLLDNGLIFKHNGKLRFTVSNPNPDIVSLDKENGKYGSVNSITAIGYSTKSGRADDTIKIGKFGVGFKAVFQYTDVAYIYDENIWFKISDYIVPSLLDNDHKARGKNETLFYLPFDKKSVSKKKAYEEILHRLQSLDNPILFLNNLQKLSWSTQKQEKSGIYEKIVKEEYSHNGIICKKISNINNIENNLLWLFTKEIEIENEWHPICVGFYLSHDSKKIDTNVRPHIYSYFVTNETLNMCIVTHAPFDLVDNRQQIKTDNSINTFLYNELAKLTGEALCELRDIGIKEKTFLLNDNILKILPLKKIGYYYSFYNTNKKPRDIFYEVLRNFLETSNLFITPEKLYVSANNGYWVDKTIRKLLDRQSFTSLISYYNFACDEFNEEELHDALKEKKCHYICTSYNTSNEEEKEYLESIGCEYFDVENFGSYFTLDFIKDKNDEWLFNFYKFLCTSEARNLIEVYNINFGERTDGILRQKPIIKLDNGEFAAPFDKYGRQNVFYKSEELSGSYNIVNQSLLSNPDFAELLRKFEINLPTSRVLVEQNILPKYENPNYLCSRQESKNEFKLIFEAYLECSKEEISSYIEVVNNKLKLLSINSSILRHIDKLYAYTDDVIKYFNGSSERIFDYELYKINHTRYNEFINKLQFNDHLSIITDKWSGNVDAYKWKSSITGLESFDGLYNWLQVSITNYHLDGFHNFLENNLTLESSIALWNLLCKTKNLEDFFSARFKYLPRNDHRCNYKTMLFHSRLLIMLQNEKWLYNRNNELCSPNKIYKEDISPMYSYDERLFQLLEIKNSLVLSKLKEIDDPFLLAWYAIKDKLPLNLKENIDNAKNIEEVTEILLKSISKDTLTIKENKKNNLEDCFDDFNQPKQDNIDVTDFGEDVVVGKCLPQTISKPRARSLESFEEKYLEDLEKQTHAETLYETIENTEQYSALWFKSLLELEYISSGEANYSNNNKGYKIIFNELDSSEDYRHLIILKNPSRSIPRSIEECENIDVTFIFKDFSSRSMKFEVASAQEYSLKLKCALINQEELQSIVMVKNQIQRIVLETNKPICLIEKLKNAFANLNLADDYSCLKNLPNNISFIFGPPGTGKTTYLVKKHINEISIKRNLKRTLILCPTNKACDVILDKATRILDPRSEYDKWLYRFIVTGDERLEPFVCNRDLDVNNIEKLCLISTIARFPYDGFRNAQLDEIEWDTIIIDEASMIPLAYIVYIIYKCPNAKFIIAGDPFQIEPIVLEPLWEGENIYSMVNLNDFNTPETRPHQFEIIKLDTQYRSIPSIGRVYSEYAYNGLLKHNRNESTQRDLLIDKVNFKSINFVAFPVRNNDSLYESKRISTSNVHVHSAIFTYEFIKFIADQLNEDDKEWRIGVISPYKAEADIVYKLWTQKCSSYSKVNVQVGTVHGFQGDECDIIIALYNPPASGLVRNKFRTFVNRKNILNVAISRARDYLFLLYPDQKSPHFDDLIAIKQVGKIVNLNSQYRAAYTTEALENIIFGDSNYIENNTFITNHQLANVYTEPISKYEIRIDENSVDIQTQ